MVAKTAWIQCKISPGQFSQEYAIRALDNTGAEFSLFVSNNFVEHSCGEIEDGTECEGRLMVEVLKEKGELVLVGLPGRTFANGSTVTVLRNQLELIEPSHA